MSRIIACNPGFSVLGSKLEETFLVICRSLNVFGTIAVVWVCRRHCLGRIQASSSAKGKLVVAVGLSRCAGDETFCMMIAMSVSNGA
jgi:hypothetical protein